MKQILFFLFFCSLTISAQELTDITNIPGDGWQTIGHAPISMAEELIEDEGRYYIVVRGDEVRRYVDLDFEDIPYGFEYVFANGDTIDVEFNYLLEYSPGEGIIDYTAFSGSSRK